MDFLTVVSGFFFTDANPAGAAFTIPLFLEYGAVVTGAICGALVACERQLDIVGAVVSAILAGLGGGLLRDIILPIGSVYMLENPLSIIVCAVVALAVFFFSGLFYKLDKPIAVFDIVSVALFSVVGCDKSVMAGYGLIVSTLMGAMTGVGGGMVRDIAIGRVPVIFRSGNWYAICSVAGALVYYLLVEAHMTKLVAAILASAVVLVLRWASLRFNLITVTAVDLTPRLTGPLSMLYLRKSGKKILDTSAGDGGDARDDGDAQGDGAGGSGDTRGGGGSDAGGGVTKADPAGPVPMEHWVERHRSRHPR